ncbi:hypothetical protein DFH29DRAFT_1071500 [Suillus ampliporus]|nr:hypothetical protein DFH29DRAFT_1071500 [Suillus ampliporus]
MPVITLSRGSKIPYNRGFEPLQRFNRTEESSNEAAYQSSTGSCTSSELSQYKLRLPLLRANNDINNLTDLQLDQYVDLLIQVLGRRKLLTSKPFLLAARFLLINAPMRPRPARTILTSVWPSPHHDPYITAPASASRLSMSTYRRNIVSVIVTVKGLNDSKIVIQRSCLIRKERKGHRWGHYPTAGAHISKVLRDRMVLSPWTISGSTIESSWAWRVGAVTILCTEAGAPKSNINDRFATAKKEDSCSAGKKLLTDGV